MREIEITGLKELIKERFDHSEKQRDYQFEQIEKQLKEMQSDLTSQLKKIDADIRGNGKVGINVQLDRLENSKKAAKKWFWIVVASIAPVLIANYFSWLSKVFN